jgi:hypothetical protein
LATSFIARPKEVSKLTGFIINLGLKMSLDLAVLVSSFDAYSDLWPPFFANFHRQWPDCPFPIYLLANRKTFPDPKVRMILAESVTAWPDSMRLALSQIREEFVLLTLEDIFFSSKVDTAEILRLGEWIALHRPACTRLNPVTGMVPSAFPGICKLPLGIPYRSSTVLSLWRKDVLLDLLKPGESIWQFEVMGSVRTDKYPDFYAAERPNFPYLHGVIRGKWVPEAQRRLIAEGIPVDVGARPKFSFSDRLIQFGRQLRARALQLISVRYQRRIRLLFATTPSSPRVGD